MDLRRSDLPTLPESSVDLSVERSTDPSAELSAEDLANCLPKAWRTVCRTIRQTAAPERKTLGRPQNLLFTVFGFRIVLVVRRRFMVLDVRIVAFKIEIRTVIQVMALDADRFRFPRFQMQSLPIPGLKFRIASDLGIHVK